ncbi:MAG: LysR family transcriptional regulator [Sedimentibacter sp.]|nr:LysR family transcriptional regulator [Sedimentibacter sp.]
MIDDPLPQIEWRCWHTVNVPVVVIANPLHPFSGRHEIKLEKLAGQEFVLEESAPYSVNFQRIMAGHQIELKPFLKLQSTDMARRLVESEQFLSLLPLYAVQSAVEQGHIKVLQIPELTQMQAVQVVLHINKIVTPQVEGFMEELRAVLQRAINLK